MEDRYVLPMNAAEKLTAAEKNSQTVYIFAKCGFGKTALVRNYYDNTSFLYFDMLSDSASILDLEVPTKKKTLVVIDNLSFISNSLIKDKVLEIACDNQFHCILISRAKCPEWLVSSSTYLGHFTIITENDLALSLNDTKILLENNGICDLNDNDIISIHKYTKGHPLFTRYIANRMLSLYPSSDRKPSFDENVKQGVWKLLSDYLDKEILDKWSESLINFTIKMSIVPAFSIPLAVEITEINNIEDMISQAEEIDDILDFHDGLYSISMPLKKYFNSKMYSLYSKELIDEIYNNAGRYYKRHHKILDAFRMYEKSDNKNQQLELLIENARLNPSDGYLTELKSAYFSLDEEIIKEHPELMAAVCMLYSLNLDVTNSDYWYDVLKERSETLTGKTQKVAKRYLTYLDVACIHKPGQNVLHILKNVATTVFDKNIVVPEWALTCNGPTIMNGGRDFCEWSKNDRELYTALSTPFKTIFGKSSAGMAELSLAESFLEKGESDYEIMRLVSKGQMDADMRGRAELSFVALGLLAQLHIIHNHTDDAIRLITSFKEKNPDANPKLIHNIDTFLCRIDLIMGNMDKVKDWLDNAPDEILDFNVLLRYSYMCKIRCYLAFDKYDEAYSLLNKMIYYADLCERKYIKMECLILMSILERRKNLPEWDSTLCSALEMAENYHFIRIISREGVAVFDMLKKCSYKFKNAAYKKQLFDEVEQVAETFPSYLSEKQCEKTSISDNALTILKLQAQGFSNEEISRTLYISLNTVKYHCKENYRKLGVNNKSAAILEARKQGLI